MQTTRQYNRPVWSVYPAFGPRLQAVYGLLVSLALMTAVMSPNHAVVHGDVCPFGHAVEDLLCAFCNAVRYVGSCCEHVPQANIIRRKWDGLPLCESCLRSCADFA